MVTKKATIDLYFDVLSPYAFIGFETMLRFEKVMPVTVNLKPFLIGAIFKETGNKPPGLNKRKWEHMMRDVAYNNAYWGLNLVEPRDFFGEVIPRTSIKAQRLLTVIEQELPREQLIRSARELFRRVWTIDQPIDKLENLREVAKNVNLTDPERMISMIELPEIKQMLKDRTTEALNNGCFGAPWIVFKRTGEPDRVFFGSDRLHFISELLGQPFPGPMQDIKIV
uniref:Glutathione S-transferase kappa n=2 Tax=Steinernema glaseri TaxID=37863 RepID=A0A1I8A080_9BILA